MVNFSMVLVVFIESFLVDCGSELWFEMECRSACELSIIDCGNLSGSGYGPL